MHQPVDSTGRVAPWAGELRVGGFASRRILVVPNPSARDPCVFSLLPICWEGEARRWAPALPRTEICHLFTLLDNGDGEISYDDRSAPPPARRGAQ